MDPSVAPNTAPIVALVIVHSSIPDNKSQAYMILKLCSASKEFNICLRFASVEHKPSNSSPSSFEEVEQNSAC